jgi:hypothetical protein
MDADHTTKRPGEISLPELAEKLRTGGLTTKQQFEAADMCDRAAAELGSLRQKTAHPRRQGWMTPW